MRNWILLLLLLPGPILAQEYLNLSAGILSVAKSPDDREIALTTKDSVYVLDVSNFAILKKWKHGMEFPTILGFHPSNSHLLLLQKNNVPPALFSGVSDYSRLQQYIEYDKRWQETPQDSIYIWDVAKAKVIQSAPGNFYVQFGSHANEMAGILTRLYRNTYFADSSEIFTKRGEKQQSSTWPKACRRLLLNDSASCFAASWSNPIGKEGSSYAFSVHDLLTHTPRFQLDDLSELPVDFCFSASGKWLAISGLFKKEKEATLRIYELPDFRLQSEVPILAKQIHFSSDETKLEYLGNNGIWTEWDILQNKKTRTIWSNLTSLFSFENVIPFEEELMFTGTAWSGIPMNSTPYNQLERVGRKDLELFSTLDQPEIRPLADTAQFTMLLNDFNPGNTHPTISFSSDHKIFTLQFENQLQVWNAVQRKKIFQRQFNAKIKAYPDRSGHSILVIEERGQMNYSEYRLHRISLVENTLFTTGILNGGDSTLNGTSLSCECHTNPAQDESWDCIDGSHSRWRIQGKELKQTLRKHDPSHKFFRQSQGPDGVTWLIVSDADEKKSLWKTDGSDVTLKFIRSISEERLVAGANGYWVWKDKNTSIQYWVDSGLIRTDTLPGPIDQAYLFPDQDQLLVQFENASYIGWQLLSPSQAFAPQYSKWIGGKLYPLSRGMMLLEHEGLFSVKGTNQSILDWSVASPQVLSTTNFSVSAGGRYLLLGNSLVDLKEITQIKIDKYHSAQLLQDTGNLQWIELVEDRDFRTGKSRFNLIRLERGGLDTAWGKTWFSPPMDGKSYFSGTLKISSDRRWVIAAWDPILTNATPPPPILWNTQTLEGLVLPVGKGLYTANFSESGANLIVRSYSLLPSATIQKEQISTYRLVPFKKISQLERTTAIDFVAPTEADQYLIRSRNICWYKTIQDSVRLLKQFYSRDYLERVVFDSKTGLLMAGTNQGTIHFWRREGYRSPIKTLQLHQSAVARMEIRGDRLFTLGEDGSIAILDIPSQKILVQILTVQREGEISMAFYTPEGFYRADPGLSPLVHFIKNGKIFPLSSFEYQGNRPDKIYAAMGFAEPSFIDLLRKSWEARLRRANIPVVDKPMISTYPVVEWDRTNLEALTNDSIFQLMATLTDPLAKRCQLFIRINGVPLGSRNGEWMDLADHRVSVKRKLPLTSGKNRISIRAVNERGQEGVEQEYEVMYYPDKPVRSRVFYAGVGVSEYADSNYNLRYAAKDVGDLSEKLGDYLDQVVSLVRINEHATKENILQLHDWLRQAGTEDVVILSLSGHGMVDSSKGFVFAPHDMDFKNPIRQGLTMDELEFILDDIPARKKLLLLDACHSGEAWADTVKISGLPKGISVTPRGLIKETSNQPAAVQKQAFLLMKELFSDLTRGNGAFMISAAGSTEFAFEGNEWRNGVFTLSLLQSIHELRYQNAPKRIPMSLLRRTIYEKVRTLTRGMQNPTSRQENGWWDWTF